MGGKQNRFEVTGGRKTEYFWEEMENMGLDCYSLPIFGFPYKHLNIVQQKILIFEKFAVS